MRPGMPGSHLAPPVPETCVGSEGVCAGDTAIAVAPEDEGSTGTDMDRKQGQHDVGDPPGDDHDGFQATPPTPISTLEEFWRAFANLPLHCALPGVRKGDAGLPGMATAASGGTRQSDDRGVRDLEADRNKIETFIGRGEEVQL